jgi:hypothetical protein
MTRSFVYFDEIFGVYYEKGVDFGRLDDVIFHFNRRENGEATCNKS